MPSKKIRYELSSYQLVAPYVSQMLFHSDDYITYQAGQYIKVVHKDDSESLLSIACAPFDLSQIELHLSHHPRNTKAQDILRMIREDGCLTICGPYGVCTASRFLMDCPIIFFVRGTGFAPVKAIMEELARVKSCPAIHLYWGVATQEDFYLHDVVENWRREFVDFRYTPFVGRSADQHQLQDFVIADYPDLSGHQVYASGPLEMISSGLELFERHGLNRARFYSDVLA